MLKLHLSGSPLAPTQGELTHAQREFLIYALEERERQMSKSNPGRPKPRVAHMPRARLARRPRKL